MSSSLSSSKLYLYRRRRYQYNITLRRRRYHLRNFSGGHYYLHLVRALTLCRVARRCCTRQQNIKK